MVERHDLPEGARVNSARISDRLADAIARLDQVYGYILDPEDAATVSQVAADLAELKLEVERETFRPQFWVGVDA